MNKLYVSIDEGLQLTKDVKGLELTLAEANQLKTTSTDEATMYYDIVNNAYLLGLARGYQHNQQ